MKTCLSTYLQLGKFTLSLLVLFTAAIGYGLAAQHFYWLDFSLFLLGTLLCSMGANGLNQWWEREKDQSMLRTRSRPIPAGKVSPKTAFVVTSGWLCGGLLLLLLFTHSLVAILALATALIYLFAYTPLKTHTCIAVLVGAIPGAIPPLMGWAAASGTISYQAWALACILYLWQIPHFMALASLYRNDYKHGGFKLLPDNPERQHLTRSIILVFSIALLSISLLIPLTGLGHIGFVACALLFGGLMVKRAYSLYQSYSIQGARKVFIVSILYLPSTLTLLLFEHTFLPLLSGF